MEFLCLWGVESADAVLVWQLYTHITIWGRPKSSVYKIKKKIKLKQK